MRTPEDLIKQLRVVRDRALSDNHGVESEFASGAEEREAHEKDRAETEMVIDEAIAFIQYAIGERVTP